MRQTRDLKNKKVGRLTVLERVSNSRVKNTAAYWKCLCACGNETVVRSDSLAGGKTQSCGCLGQENRSTAVKIGDGHSPATAVLRDYKTSARRRGIAYDLTDEQAFDCMLRPCAYCGANPNTVRYIRDVSHPFVHNGIDRVDNSRGYVLDNINPCCETCNRAKLTQDLEEFKHWVKRTHDHLWGKTE